MAKVFTIVGMLIAVLLVLLFAADLAVQVPFRRASPTMDIGFIICAILFGLLSWQTLREQQ